MSERVLTPRQPPEERHPRGLGTALRGAVLTLKSLDRVHRDPDLLRVRFLISSPSPPQGCQECGKAEAALVGAKLGGAVLEGSEID